MKIKSASASVQESSDLNKNLMNNSCNFGLGEPTARNPLISTRIQLKIHEHLVWESQGTVIQFELVYDG